jgi:hypothetical protein
MNIRSLAASAVIGAVGSFSGAASAFPNALGPFANMFPGNALVGGSCFYQTVMQANGNLVTLGGNWSSNTPTAIEFGMASDGNFEALDRNGNIVWSTGTSGHPGSKVVQLDDGRLVVLSPQNQVLWQSTAPEEGLGQTPCEKTTSYIQYYPKQNTIGGDYTHFTLPGASAGLCGYHCAEDPRCLAFTWVEAGVEGPDPVCWLKDSQPALTSDSRTVSGYWVQMTP